MRAIQAGFSIRKKLGLARLGRKPRKAAEPPRSLLRDFDFSSDQSFGFRVDTVSPKTKASRVIIYLHGGGYVVPIAKQHWQLIEQLVRETNATVIVPRYGLAPEFGVSEALELVGKVVEQARGLDLELVLAGDSAGGGLALASIQQLALQSAISKLLLISPWLDSGFDDPELPMVLSKDPWLIPENLREIARVWSERNDPSHPAVAPLRGEMKSLPRTFLMIGQWDILLFGARELSEIAKQKGLDLVYEELENALHVYPLLPTPEGKAARNRIVGFLLDQ